MILFKKYILTPFRETIHKYGDRNAFYIDGTYCTYEQFAQRVSAIRGEIRKAEKNEQIWVALHYDLNTYASIFALWMEGKAYVPLHPYTEEQALQTCEIINRITR